MDASNFNRARSSGLDYNRAIMPWARAIALGGFSAVDIEAIGEVVAAIVRMERELRAEQQHLTQNDAQRSQTAPRAPGKEGT